MRRFEGKTAIATGASRGIGLAIAEGARVVITGRTKDTPDQAAAVLGGPAHVLGVAWCPACRPRHAGHHA
ncbi:hypothetical protein [Streptomyces vietnamensis]|uniref:hypothetical protein n=1 Tax=Streptomyces vietnamensis TaxID=362257 RepID=UPI00341C01C4